MPSLKSSMPRFSPYSESPGRASELAAATPPKAPAATPTVSPPAASPFDQRDLGRSFRSGDARWAPLPDVRRCSGTVGPVDAAPPAVPSSTMASMAATSCARCTTLTSAASVGLGSSPRPPARANSRPCSVGSADAAGCSPAAPWGTWSSRAWAKAFARRCAETFAITGGTSSRHDDRLPWGFGRLHALSASTGSLHPAQRASRHLGYARKMIGPVRHRGVTDGELNRTPVCTPVCTRVRRPVRTSARSPVRAPVLSPAVSGRPPEAAVPACAQPGTARS